MSVNSNSVDDESNGEKAASESTRKKSIGFVILLLAGVLCGYGAAMLFGGSLPDEAKGTTILLHFLWFMLSIYISMLLQIIAHESGHLIAGLRSGYRFVSFRIGKLTIISINGKLRLKRFSITGTAGQCLMKPPKAKDYRFPYILYNLGGSIGNIIVSLICLVLYYICPDNIYLAIFLACIFILGIVFALTNGIPMRLGGIANDGYNAYSLGKDSYALRSIWIQLTVNALLAEGTRLRDMPEEWFDFDRQNALNNPIICSLGVLRCAYLFDKMMFDEARELTIYLEKDAPGILELQRKELRCDLLFYELIGARRSDVIERLYNKNMKKYIKASGCYPSRKRLMYAYELLYMKNQKAAVKQLTAFEKLVKTYPYSAELDTEREMITYIRGLAARG